MLGKINNGSIRIAILVLLFSLLDVASLAADIPDVPERYRKAVEQKVEQAETVIKKGTYSAGFESLAAHDAAPEWFRDAKFGIYFHWGIYSLPAYGNEWYPRWMYSKEKRSHFYDHHVQNYGEPSEFPYTKFVPKFQAKNFDADKWAQLFKNAGARYAGPVAEHHDGYSMWDSDLTPWNTADKGPMRDITGELEKAIRDRGMKFVVTFHHARNNLWSPEEGKWTGHYSELKKYFPKLLEDTIDAMMYGYMPRDFFEKYWLAKLVEVVDKYQPDLVWFDSWLNEISEKRRAQFAAYYFNKARSWGKDVVITRKQDDLPVSFSIEDFEKGRMDKLTDHCWFTDDTISMGSWCYTQDLKIKPTRQVLHVLIDIVSKNGCLLLNISPKADGTIPDDQKQVLLDIGRWLQVNGEAIYNTRPWLSFGEGPTRLEKGGGFTHRHGGYLQYTSEDIRFTRSKDNSTLYAIVLGWPGKQIKPKSILVESEDNARVSLIGFDKLLNYSVDSEKRLTIDVPDLDEDRRPCRYAYVFKLTGFKLSLHE